MSRQTLKELRREFARIGVRATIADEVAARRGCRNGLAECLVSHRGQVFAVNTSTWDEHGDLIVRLEIGPDRTLVVYASQCTLFGDWPSRCCRTSKRILRQALARRAVAAGRKGGRL